MASVGAWRGNLAVRQEVGPGREGKGGRRRRGQPGRSRRRRAKGGRRRGGDGGERRGGDEGGDNLGAVVKEIQVLQGHVGVGARAAAGGGGEGQLPALPRLSHLCVYIWRGWLSVCTQ